MENILQYKYIIIGLCSGLGALIAASQAQRKPEEIILNEKPKVQTIITIKPANKAVAISSQVAMEFGFTLYDSDSFHAVFTSNKNFFSWGYVLRIKSESSNSWSSKLILELYSKAESGFGQKIITNNKLNSFVESVRVQLKAH